MRKALHIVRHNLSLLASDRAALAWLFVMPVAFTLATGLFVPDRGTRASGPVRYGLTVANLDAGPRGAALLRMIEESDEIDLLEIEGDGAAEEAERLVNEGERSSALVIPEDYSKRIERGEETVLAFYRNPERMNPLATRPAVEAAVARINVEAMARAGVRDAYAELWGEPSESKAERIVARAQEFISDSWETPAITVVTETLGRARQLDIPRMGFSHSSPAMALMFVLLNGLMTSGILVEERRSKTLSRLFTAPLRRSQIIGANLGWRFVVGMAQFWFLVALGALLFRVDWGDSPTGLIVIGVTYIAAVSSLAVLIGTFSRSPRQAETLSLLLSLTMCAVGGLWWPIEITPTAYQRAAHMIPTGWAMDALHNLVSRGYSLAQVAPQAVVLLGFALAFSVVAVLTFRYE